jgi:uncharacterized membrane protein
MRRCKTTDLTLIAAVPVLASMAMATMAPAAPRFQGLPSLLGDFSPAVSADGSTVVGGRYRWTTAGGLQPLYPLTTATAVNADGSVIVGQGDVVDSNGILNDGQPVRWVGGVVQWLGVLPGVVFDTAYGVSGDGSVVVGGNSGRWRWTAANGLEQLPFYAYAISADGAVVVGDDVGGAVRWTSSAGTQVIAADPYTSARGVSADGSTVVGGTYYGNRGAFRWTEAGGLQSLGSLSEYSDWAFAVSADGSVIVGGSDPAFIWDAAHGMRSLRGVLVDELGLNLDGWNLRYATGISADGLTIVGRGVNPSGQEETWIAVIPEPALLPLVGLFTGAMLRRRRRNRFRCHQMTLP